MRPARPDEDTLGRTAAVLALERELDHAFAAFLAAHEALLRTSCQVPEHVTDLSNVVACTFLGHALTRVRERQGSERTRQLALTVLESLEQIDAAKREHRGTLQ